MIIQNIIDSWKHIPYTLRHYIAFLKTEKIHRAINKHHIQNHKAAWECCRLTKPQEPMSAREYLEYKKETLRDVHYGHNNETI